MKMSRFTVPIYSRSKIFLAVLRNFKFIITVVGAFIIFTPSACAYAATYNAVSSSVQGMIFQDRNHNGRRESAESGMADITVHLFTASGEVIAEKISVANGTYTFEIHSSGEYYLRFSKPNGFSFSPKDNANDETKDSDVNPYTGETDPFSLGSEQALTNLDAGLFEEPTVAWITDFHAERDDSEHIWLLWETGTELDIFGFNLYRSTTLCMNDEAINPDIIIATSPGGIEGSAYGYEDMTAKLSTDYYYWLEVMRISGPLMYGPVYISKIQGVLFLPVLFKPLEH